MSHSLVRPRIRGISALALILSASIAQAQVDSRKQYSDPLDPQASVPAVVYKSPLADYRRLGEDKQVPWSEANDTVNRIGGWRTYAREAQQPETAGAASGKPATASPATGADSVHRGHKAHGGMR